MAFLYPPGRPYYPNMEAISLIHGYSPVFVTDNMNLHDELKLKARTLTPDYSTVFAMPGRGPGRVTFIKSIQDLFDSIEPTVVITYEVFSSLSYQVARLRKKRDFMHIVFADDTVPIQQSTWGKFPLTRLFAKHVAGHADLFVAHSLKASKSLQSAGAPSGRISQMNFCMFLKPFLELRRDINKETCEILYIGRLRKNKGIETLLRAFKSLVGKGHPDMRLVIAGTGPLRETVEAAAAADSRIRYEGYVAEERKMKLLASSDVFVYPSEDIHFMGTVRWEEQAGVSVMEAMTAGLPVIASDSGALGEVIGRDDMVVPQGNAEALAERIMALQSDPAKRAEVGAFNKKRSIELFDIEKYAEKLAELIEDRRQA